MDGRRRPGHPRDGAGPRARMVATATWMVLAAAGPALAAASPADGAVAPRVAARPSTGCHGAPVDSGERTLTYDGAKDDGSYVE